MDFPQFSDRLQLIIAGVERSEKTGRLVAEITMRFTKQQHAAIEWSDVTVFNRECTHKDSHGAIIGALHRLHDEFKAGNGEHGVLRADVQFWKGQIVSIATGIRWAG